MTAMPGRGPVACHTADSTTQPSCSPSAITWYQTANCRSSSRCDSSWNAARPRWSRAVAVVTSTAGSRSDANSARPVSALSTEGPVDASITIGCRFVRT